MADISIDHKTNIDEIIRLITTADKTLFDSAAPSKQKLRKVFFAETNYDMEDDVTPYCYVEVADEFESTPEPFGSEFSGLNQSTASYKVTVVDSQGTGTAASMALALELLEKIRVILVANTTLTGLITRMNISKATRKQKEKGSEKNGMFFTIGVVIGKEFSIEFPAPLGTLNMISWPLDTVETMVDEDNLDSGLRVVTPKNDKDRIDIEVETNFSRSAQISTIIKAKDEISVTMNNGSDTRVLTVLPVSFMKPVPFDQFQRAVIGMEIINS